jgi:hypothetical protein
MAETWANGLDLHLDLAGSLRRLETALSDAIRSGRIQVGLDAVGGTVRRPAVTP